MNEETTESETAETPNAVTECCAKADRYVRQNPGTTLVCALGVGLVIGLIVRALRPAPTAHERMAHMLENLEDRLRGVTGPALRKASELAHDGLEAVHNGEAKVARFFGQATRRVRSFFS